MKNNADVEKTSLNHRLNGHRPFLGNLSKSKKKIAHMDEYEAYADMAELDLGDGFNAFDEDFYHNLYY